jgi:hypothetical protein
MSKVLLVEPDKMLRQAFIVALFPEFEIQVVDALPDVAPKDVDVLIVDAAARLKQDPESAPKIRVVAKWNLPIIWIDADRPAQNAHPAHFTRLNGPVAKDTLRRALAQCLMPPGAAKAEEFPSAQAAKSAPRPKPKSKSKNTMDNASGESRTFIDLVDVVEEESGR